MNKKGILKTVLLTCLFWKSAIKFLKFIHVQFREIW